MQTLKECIFNLIKDREQVTFVELQSNFDIAGGDYTMTPRLNSNICYWIGLKKEGVDAIEELIHEKKIFAHPTNLLTYMVDGLTLNMKLAKSDRDYKTPHWYPIIFCTYPPAKGY